MTLILFDGLDNWATMPKKWMVFVSGAQMNTGRDGSTNGARYFQNGTSFTIELPTPASTCIWGMAINFTDTLTPESLLKTWQSGGVTQLVLVPNTSGFLELRRTSRTGTLLATSSGHPPLSTSTWWHLQTKVVLHTTTGSVVVKLEGQTIINYSGVTSSANAAVDRVTSGNTASPTGGDYSVDDLYICDDVDATATQGRPNNDFLGDLKVVTLVPTGAGDETDWTPSTGTNFGALDENPPTTTDYVSRDAGAAGDRDLYTATDLPAAAALVVGLQSHAYAGKDDIGEATLKQVIKENGVVTSLGADSALGLAVSTSTTPIHTKRPSDGALLSVADINGMQIGVEVG